MRKAAAVMVVVEDSKSDLFFSRSLIASHASDLANSAARGLRGRQLEQIVFRTE
jgi:hypothetical protein